MGDRFKQILKRLGFSNNSFAKELKITEGTVRNIINNKGNSISPTVLTYLFNRGYNINWLLTGEGGMFLEDKDNDDSAASRVKVKFDDNGLPITEIIPVHSKKSKSKSADVVSLEGLSDSEKEHVINTVKLFLAGKGK